MLSDKGKQLKAARAADNGQHPDDPEPAEPVADEPRSLLLGMRTAAWLDTQVLPELEVVVPGLTTEGLGILVGPPKIGKSWLVAGLGLAAACGGKALRQPQRGAAARPLPRVGGRRPPVTAPLRRIMGDQPKPEGLHYITKAKRHEVIGIIEEFLELHADRKPLIILDTLGRARPFRHAGEDVYQSDYMYGEVLKNAVDAVPGAALVVVHHTRKAETRDFIDAVSGSHGIAGSADYVIVLERKRQAEDGILHVSGRDIAEGEYAVHADQGVLWRLDGPDLGAAAKIAEGRRERSSLGEGQFALLTLVNSQAETTVTEAAKKLDITSKQAGDALRRLCESGRIARPRRGVYTPTPQNPRESAESAESAGPSPLFSSDPESESAESAETDD